MWSNKNKNCLFKVLMAVLTVLSITVLVGVSYMNKVLPEEFNVISGAQLKVEGSIPIKAVYSGESLSETKISKEKTTKDAPRAKRPAAKRPAKKVVPAEQTEEVKADETKTEEGGDK